VYRFPTTGSGGESMITDVFDIRCEGTLKVFRTSEAYLTATD
jgi:hypothetical protein